MAIRLARAISHRNKLVRFKYHFHDWQDHVAFGSKYAGTENVPGIIDGIIENVIVADPADPRAVSETLERDEDIAAVILEPTGASSGQIPLGRDRSEQEQGCSQKDRSNRTHRSTSLMRDWITLRVAHTKVHDRVLYPVSRTRTFRGPELRDTSRGHGPRGASRHGKNDEAIHRSRSP